MKVAVECKSPLLQKSLEKFLGNALASSKHSDIIISDEKKDGNKYFYISSDSDADLIKPFSKSQLILALKKRYKALNPPEQQTTKQDMDFDILKRRIEALTYEYQQNILDAIKAFYGE